MTFIQYFCFEYVLVIYFYKKNHSTFEWLKTTMIILLFPVFPTDQECGGGSPGGSGPESLMYGRCYDASELSEVLQRIL